MPDIHHLPPRIPVHKNHLNLKRLGFGPTVARSSVGPPDGGRTGNPWHPGCSLSSSAFQVPQIPQIVRLRYHPTSEGDATIKPFKSPPVLGFEPSRTTPMSSSQLGMSLHNGERWVEGAGVVVLFQGAPMRILSIAGEGSSACTAAKMMLAAASQENH